MTRYVAYDLIIITGRALTPNQIVAREALPFTEIERNPYGVMMTTSWGGHLGWFELGGKRWFVEPVSSILHFASFIKNSANSSR